MWQLLYSLRGAFNASWRSSERFIFFLNYRVTTVVLLFACVIVTSNIFVGRPIGCSCTSWETPRAVVESYCWVESTYSVATAYGKVVNSDVPHPGVDISEDKSQFIHRDYYQWVGILLFIQAIFFYIPHAVWKGLEKDRLEELMRNFEENKYDQGDDDDEVTRSESHQKALRRGAAYFSKGWGLYDDYIACYILCEFLSLFNICIQFFLLDLLFQGEFKNLGIKTADYLISSRSVDDSPLSRVFPRVTMCTFNKFGPSGSIDTVDVLCVLAVNTINEIIFLLMWFWLFILSILTFINVCILLVSACSKSFRVRMISVSLKTATVHETSNIKQLLTNLCIHGDFGDWFLLSCISFKFNAGDMENVLTYIQEKLELNTDETVNNMLTGENEENETAV